MNAVTTQMFQLLWPLAAALQLLLPCFGYGSSAGTIDNTGLPGQVLVAVQSRQANQPQVAETQRQRAPPQRSTAPDCVLGPRERNQLQPQRYSQGLPRRPWGDVDWGRLKC
jgi:hypothetical protein